MFPPSGQTLMPGENVTQEMRVKTNVANVSRFFLILFRWYHIKTISFTSGHTKNETPLIICLQWKSHTGPGRS